MRAVNLAGTNLQIIKVILRQPGSCILMQQAISLPSAVQDIIVGAFLFLFIAMTTSQGRFLDWRA